MTAILTVFVFSSLAAAEPALNLDEAFARTQEVVAAAAQQKNAAATSLVPNGCLVQSWCLVKATDCFLGFVSHPAGLNQGHSQYSVVRKVVALCPTGYYNQLQQVILTGPVEPVTFASETETTEETASMAAMKLCTTYRQDWVAAAPVCAP